VFARDGLESGNAKAAGLMLAEEDPADFNAAAGQRNETFDSERTEIADQRGVQQNGAAGSFDGAGHRE
jgi:hypothetical protein